jgi:hypothetical protein
VRFGSLLAVLKQSLKMQCYGLADVALDLRYCPAGGDATGQIGDESGETVFAVLDDIAYLSIACLSTGLAAGSS